MELFLLFLGLVWALSFRNKPKVAVWLFCLFVLGVALVAVLLRNVKVSVRVKAVLRLPVFAPPPIPGGTEEAVALQVPAPPVPTHPAEEEEDPADSTGTSDTESAPGAAGAGTTVQA